MASIAVEHTHSGRRWGLKPVQWLMLGIVALAVGVGAYSLRGSLARSVTLAEARTAGGTVQIFGYIHSKGQYDAQNNWTFEVQDSNGDTMTIVNPTKPGNFDDAISVAATGRYVADSDTFQAEQLLVKCPSKYQEAGVAAGG